MKADRKRRRGRPRGGANGQRIRDYPVVLAGVAVLSAAFVTINLVVDLLYTCIDPRVRLGSS